VFAKRKKNIFKGPMLSLGRDSKSGPSGSASHSRSASASGLGRRSGEITIQEVDEDEEEEAGFQDGGGDDDVEEVDSFSPIVRAPGEQIEEKIFEEGEDIAAIESDTTTKGKEPDRLQTPIKLVAAASS